MNWKMSVKSYATTLYHGLQRLAGWRQATIIVYHSIGEPADRYTVTPSVFARQIKLLRDRFDIVPLRDIESAFNQPSSPRRRVAITFDDAFISFQENALAVLKTLSVPATIFVPSGLMGRTNEWDEEEDLPVLKIMTIDQIRNINSENLIDIGSHTVNHPNLGELSASQIQRQVVESKQTLEKILGSSVEMFAYPFGGYGNFSGLSTRLLKKAGYRIGVTTVWGTKISPRNLLTLRRIYLDDRDTDQQICDKVNGAYDWRGIRQLGGHIFRNLKQITQLQSAPR